MVGPVGHRGSGAITADRMTRLWMTAPYRAEAQRFYVREDSSYRRPSDLDGKRISARELQRHI
jgi:ABC-type amino acid transport substrate-binding protein